MKERLEKLGKKLKENTMFFKNKSGDILEIKEGKVSYGKVGTFIIGMSSKWREDSWMQIPKTEIPKIIKKLQEMEKKKND